MTMPSAHKSAERHARAGEGRVVDKKANKGSGEHHNEAPAAGAHAADHLVNEDATPGAGALPSHAHRSGKEVDGGAG